MPNENVNEDNGFTKDEIERFDIVILFKQIEIMLNRHYEPMETQLMIESMISCQDKVRYSGINRFDDDEITGYKEMCLKCGYETLHHHLSDRKECSVCGQEEKYAQ